MSIIFPALVEVLVTMIGLNPSATTTPSVTTALGPIATSRIGAPRSMVPVANYSVYLSLI